MNLRNRQQLLGILAIAAVALLAGDRLLLSPLGNAWKERSERVAQLRKKVSQGALLLDRETAIRSRWENMLSNALPREVSVAESQVLKAFDRWSRESGVSISSIRPQWKRGTDDSLLLECRADASGSLSSLSRFLYQVERDPIALRVDSMELSSRDSEGQQLTLGLQVSSLMMAAPKR